MSADTASRFFSEVRARPDAVARLSGCRNSEEFIDRAVVLGHEMGYDLARADVAAVLRRAEAACARATEITDDDLDYVQAAGASWEMVLSTDFESPLEDMPG